MKRIILTSLLTITIATMTACGTISPPVQPQTETTVTGPSELVTEQITPTEIVTEANEDAVYSIYRRRKADCK